MVFTPNKGNDYEYFEADSVVLCRNNLFNKNIKGKSNQIV